MACPGSVGKSANGSDEKWREAGSGQVKGGRRKRTGSVRGIGPATARVRRAAPGRERREAALLRRSRESQRAAHECGQHAEAIEALRTAASRAASKTGAGHAVPGGGTGPGLGGGTGS